MRTCSSKDKGLDVFFLCFILGYVLVISYVFIVYEGVYDYCFF